MYTIDLLQGHGLPRKHNPFRLSLLLLPFLLPVIIGGIIAGCYQQQRIVYEITEDGFVKSELKIKQYDEKLKIQRLVESKFQNMLNIVGEIKDALDFRVQLSELLNAFISRLPEQIYLKEMEVSRQVKRVKTTQGASPQQKPDVYVERSLTMQVCGKPGDQSDKAVQEYIQTLKELDMMLDMFSSISVAAKYENQFSEQANSVYEIECVFKDQGQAVVN